MSAPFHQILSYVSAENGCRGNKAASATQSKTVSYFLNRTSVFCDLVGMGAPANM